MKMYMHTVRMCSHIDRRQAISNSPFTRCKLMIHVSLFSRTAAGPTNKSTREWHTSEIDINSSFGTWNLSSEDKLEEIQLPL